MTDLSYQKEKMEALLRQCLKEANLCAILLGNQDLIFHPDMLKATVGKLQTVKKLAKDLSALRADIEAQW